MRYTTQLRVNSVLRHCLYENAIVFVYQMILPLGMQFFNRNVHIWYTFIKYQSGVQPFVSYISTDHIIVSRIYYTDNFILPWAWYIYGNIYKLCFYKSFYMILRKYGKLVWVLIPWCHQLHQCCCAMIISLRLSVGSLIARYIGPTWSPPMSLFVWGLYAV